MILMDYSGARGTLIHEKKLKSKISCQTPFNSNPGSYKNRASLGDIKFISTSIFEERGGGRDTTFILIFRGSR
jgi:hypothetical protein